MTGTLAVLTNIPTPYRVAFFDVLATELQEQGGRLEVFYCAETEPGRQWEFEGGTVGGALLPGVSPRFHGVTYHLNPTALRRIRAVNPDWLLLAGAWNTPTMMAVSARERGLVPRIFWSEGHAAAVLHTKGPISRARRKVLESFDGFAVPNERSAAFIRSQIRSTRPVLRLPNTVDEALFDPSSVNGHTVRRAFGLPEGRRLLVIVASLEARKRVKESLVAFLGLTEQERRGTQLVIVGTGPQRDELERIAYSDSNVHFLGHLDGAMVRDILSTADGFLLASQYDPNPLSVIEAALCGCRLISTESVGNADELVRATGGAVVPDGQDEDVVAGLRDAIRALAQQAESDLRAAGTLTRKFALNRYSRSSAACSLVHDLERFWPSKGRTGSAQRRT